MLEHLVPGHRPALVDRQSRCHPPLEAHVQAQGLGVIAERVGEERERQLCWAAAAIAPRETVGAVVVEVEAQRQGRSTSPFCDTLDSGTILPSIQLR